MLTALPAGPISASPATGRRQIVTSVADWDQGRPSVAGDEPRQRTFHFPHAPGPVTLRPYPAHGEFGRDAAEAGVPGRAEIGEDGCKVTGKGVSVDA